VRYIKTKEYSIHTSIEWVCRKDDHDIDRKIKEHAQWYQVRIIIMGRGSVYCMLPGKYITVINIGRKKLCMRYGLVRNPLLNISKCLVVIIMYMFQSKI
jgi:hypothetical protein